MKEEQFIKALKERLEIFTEETVNQEIQNFLQIIKEKQSLGLTEEQAIESLGNLDQLQKDIFLKHGINPKKVGKSSGFFYQKFEELFQVIHRVVDVMSKNNFQENSKIILDLLVLIFFVCIIKIPFILVRNLGEMLFVNLDIPLVTNIWQIIVDIIYIIVAIMVFMNIFTKWFKKLKGTNEQKIKGNPLKSITLKDQEDNKKDTEK